MPKTQRSVPPHTNMEAVARPGHKEEFVLLGTCTPVPPPFSKESRARPWFPSLRPLRDVPLNLNEYRHGGHGERNSCHTKEHISRLGASTRRAASPDLDPGAEMETVLATHITRKRDCHNQTLRVAFLCQTEEEWSSIPRV